MRWTTGKLFLNNSDKTGFNKEVEKSTKSQVLDNYF